MTTNQTIEGVFVSRELLDRVLSHDYAEDCQECGIGQSSAWKELRALLDAQVAVVLTDDQILEAMRKPLNDADGGYVVDMSPENVIAAGRALIACFDELKRLNPSL